MVTGKNPHRRLMFLFVLLFIAVAIFYGTLFVKKDYDEGKMQQLATTYTGNLPCADCSALVTTLTLNKPSHRTSKGNYILHELYEGKTTTPFITQGTWLLSKGTPDDPNAFVLTLVPNDGSGTTYYLVGGKTKLTLLDQQKNHIDSPFNESLFAIDKKPAQVPNPASENCIKVGGTLSMQTRGDGGTYGLCQFDDNRACEEWTLYRGECPVGGVKTTGYDTIEQKYCAWLGGQTVADPNAKCTLPNGHICSNQSLYNGTCQ